MSPSSRISYGVAHAEGPVDGSLYATVHKRQHEFVEHSNILQNGNTQLQNGSQASSVDSGISASSGIVPCMFVFNNKPIYCYHYNKLVPVQSSGPFTIYWYQHKLLVPLQSTGTITIYLCLCKLLVPVQTTGTFFNNNTGTLTFILLHNLKMQMVFCLNHFLFSLEKKQKNIRFV
jgi:hypothetical protein